MICDKCEKGAIRDGETDGWINWKKCTCCGGLRWASCANCSAKDKYNKFRTFINPFLRRLFKLELVLIEYEGKFVGVGIRKELKKE